MKLRAAKKKNKSKSSSSQPKPKPRAKPKATPKPKPKPAPRRAAAAAPATPAMPRRANPMARGALLGAIQGFNKTALKKSKTNPPESERPPPRRDPKKPLSMMEEVRFDQQMW